MVIATVETCAYEVEKHGRNYSAEGAYPDNANVRIRLFRGLPEEREEGLSEHNWRDAAETETLAMKRSVCGMFALTWLPSTQ